MLRSVHVSFHLHFASRDAANEAAATLGVKGYTIDFRQQPDGRSVVVSATSSVPQSPDEREAARSMFSALAEELGGSFMGESGFTAIALPPDPLR